MFPSIKKLEEAFPGYGKEIRAVLVDVKARNANEHLARYESQCYGTLRAWNRRLIAADGIANTCGVEYIAHKDDGYREGSQRGLSYLNTGDTYTPTLIYDHNSDRYFVSDWGSVVENRPGRYV